MGKFKDKGYILIFWALTLLYSAAEQEYFIQSANFTWDQARNYCQACFKELVTVTPENTQGLSRRLRSDHWIGLRKNFNSNSNSTSDATGYSMSYFQTNFTDNSSSPSMSWTSWANGDPLAFQNWYPGWPVFKTPKPKIDCCSCSCTCPARETTPVTITSYTEFTPSNMTFTDMTENTTDIYNPTNQNATDFFNLSLAENGTNTDAPRTTTEPPVAAECMRSPMLLPKVLEVEDNYIEDACVAMLSFGPWVEKHCLDLLPFICYEDRFFGQVNVTNITSKSASLMWLPAPGDISHYRLEVNKEVLVKKHTDLTYDLVNLTGGTLYSVQVFPVKCERDLNPQNATFYTTPDQVKNLLYTSLTEKSVNLTWNKPDGNAAFYRLSFENNHSDSTEEFQNIDSLRPGSFYNFSVSSGVQDKSKWSDEVYITLYTKPDKVSNLKACNNTDTSVSLSWDRPQGNFTDIHVKAINNTGNETFVEQLLNQTEKTQVRELPKGTNIKFIVTARANHTLEGESVTITSFTAPGPVSDLILNTSQDTLNATWHSPNNSSVLFEVILQLNSETVTSQNTSDTSLCFKYLNSSSNYTVVVYAVSGMFKSPPVSASRFTLPVKPTDAKASDFNKTSITFEWTPPKNIEKHSYKVMINSTFWGYRETKMINETSHTFSNLKSGTKYYFEVRTEADEQLSEPESCEHYTEIDKTEISLSMLCSSATPLLCDNSTTRDNIFNQLKEHLDKGLKDLVKWELEK